MAHRYTFASNPGTDARSVITAPGASYRISVLTDGIVRIEWSPTATFEDRASTFAVNRSLPVPSFEVRDRGTQGLEISTARFHLSYDKQPFSTNGLSVQVLGGFTHHHSTWRYGSNVDLVDLGGTARTLDHVDGRMELGPAVVSRNGFALIDDSESMLFRPDGWIAPRKGEGEIDLYVFAYGREYKAAIKALYAVSGPQPTLPRWALGNWWSRYYNYTEKDYLDLMDKFKEREIPLSVAVVDMDWHIVDTPVVREAKLSGWTGYTWDRTLFPSPARFGSELKKRKLKLTLNDHPADGIHSFEDAYMEMAEALGHDTSKKDPIAFDITDRGFADAYFDVLHRRIEKECGCDFWWIDWQQGIHTRIRGIDPLWVLNHFQYLDSSLSPSGQLLNFSRFAGPGSHRYPVGFSGDTIVSWASLAFQPEFTNCASNIGYGWWSHDIGGHMRGVRDDELAARWVQYGVFSPIMRLHSTQSIWNTKEPWNFNAEACKVMEESLRLRHKLVPYLHTMNVRASADGEPICQPMYWAFPERDEAYMYPNEYTFGTNLLVVPIVEPRSSTSVLAKTKGWLPPGKWVDIFTGALYEGNRQIYLHRRLDQYPVLAPSGTVLPLDGADILDNGCPLPEKLELLVVPGADTEFTLVEGDVATTELHFSQSDGVLTVTPPSNTSELPQHRSWLVRFLGMRKPALESIAITIDSATPASPSQIEATTNGFLIKLANVPINSSLSISIGANPRLEDHETLKRCKEILKAAQVKYLMKEVVWDAIAGAEVGETRLERAARLSGIEVDEDLRAALLEQVLACSQGF
ncbi:hypothetical protein V496_04661 [Pseudogymnoascus sp. VKM F-4515 (FW-2607)]|nr:hypothetical protein V496_04661 [Pseudogymnoascus sp. VKM F-4515 (FW-2607)]KFY98871.1 hypothetical protein V498_01174 [Pseudogymnoascus sp. VKM F-4517 (FW-2822)]